MRALVDFHVTPPLGSSMSMVKAGGGPTVVRFAEEDHFAGSDYAPDLKPRGGKAYDSSTRQTSTWMQPQIDLT